ncbi:hypothetical protein [Deinococcus koreensis]|uniref:Spore coat protein U domain-containing protein n=1 Tax=Deinococcus koreensis TaxID=2054903 RepID=A0A2K3UX21_9DEIO|nr:hypothetical protein [Deinococcus koreensis]PNY81078.1 hypothetical protein CVO96_06540 [Deinococcus koreensis]
MFRVPAILFALVLGQSSAQCVITQAQVDMPTYSALRATTGTLAVRIECRTPQDTARLWLEGPGLSATPDSTLSLTVYSAASRNVQGAAPLSLTIDQGLPLLNGLPVTGSQTLRFALIAQAGQWVPVGSYTQPLTLSLRPSLP